MSDIIIIDAACGKGKTSFAIQKINDRPDDSYIYCTPFLSEITRIRDATNVNMIEPQFRGGRKVDDFNNLLMNGDNIAITHSTFANSNADTLDYLSQGNYTLFIDEVLDILVSYKDVCGDTLTKNDINLLLKKGFISVDDYGKVTWIESDCKDTKYYNVERLAKTGNLLYLDGSMFVWEFPPEIFAKFNRVYIMTYLFEGSIFKPYLEYHNINYIMRTVQQIDNGRYILIDYKSDKADRKKYKDLITIIDDKRLPHFKATQLSKNWYNRQSVSDKKKLQLALSNYIKNITKAKSRDIMWTCPKQYKKDIKSKGYNIVRRLTEDEKMLPAKEREEIEKRLSCFVPLNARATNDFADRSVLAYLFNFFPNPYIKRYFSNKNEKDGTNIAVNTDYLALSCLIQWIWRSQIRAGKPITIYIPSLRMKKLLQDWLDGIL